MTITEDKFTLKYARFVIRWRVPILVLLLIATALLATQIPKLDVRNDPDTLLPGVNRYVATNLSAEEKLGIGNLMLFAVKMKEGEIFQPCFLPSRARASPRNLFAWLMPMSWNTTVDDLPTLGPPAMGESRVSRLPPVRLSLVAS